MPRANERHGGDRRPGDARSVQGTVVAAAVATLAAAFALAGCKDSPAEPAAAPEPEPTCDAELRSWVVMGRGRHLFLQIDCPCAHDHLDGRVEYTTAGLRGDYRPPTGPAASPALPRVVRYTPGRTLRPFIGGDGDERLEATYELTLDQARCLQQDRLFSAPYALVGSNSSSGLRAAMEGCGLSLPAAVLAGGGVTGEFPGIDRSAGEEIPPERWPAFGFPAGPTPPPEPPDASAAEPSESGAPA